jgi:hypothetical protein
MSLLMAERVDRPPSLFGPDPADARSGQDGARLGGGPTLDDAIVGAWEGLAARAVAACPLCGGGLRAPSTPAAHAGRCSDCGTTLA